MDSQTLVCLRFSHLGLVRDFGIWAFYHTSQTSKSQFRRFETERPSVIFRVIIRQREIESSSSQSSSSKVSLPLCAAAEPRMGDHESDGLEYQDDEEEEEEDDEPVHDLTGGGALLSGSCQLPLQLPGYNAPRECAIRMPRGKAANTRARGPITPATGPGQASTRFCNLAEALLTTGATFGHKAAKSVCSFCVLQLHSSVSYSCTTTQAPRPADRATEAKKSVMIALAPLPFPPLRALTPSLRRVPSKVRHHCARCLRHSATAATMSGLGLLDRMGSCLGLATGVTLRLPSAARVAWQPAQMRRQWLRARRGRGERPLCLCSPSSM